MTAYFEDLPQVPFDDFQLHLFASDRGLMATPTALHHLHDQGRVLPLEHDPGRTGIDPGLRPRIRSARRPCPGQIRPFNPSLVAGTSNPTAGAFTRFTLKLNREDGDQFLGNLNFTMPPGLTANLHGVTYCPEADITAAASTPGRVEQAAPSCPAPREIGTSNVAAGPGAHPFHAVGQDLFRRPVQGRSSVAGRDHAGAGRPL